MDIWLRVLGMMLICASFAAIIYAYDGRSWRRGALLGFFLGPFGVLIARLTVGKEGQRASVPQPATLPQMHTHTPSKCTPPEPKTEYQLSGRCPYCNGPVHRRQGMAESVQCSYCGAQLEGMPVEN